MDSRTASNKRQATCPLFQRNNSNREHEHKHRSPRSRSRFQYEGCTPRSQLADIRSLTGSSRESETCCDRPRPQNSESQAVRLGHNPNLMTCERLSISHCAQIQHRLRDQQTQPKAPRCSGFEYNVGGETPDVGRELDVQRQNPPTQSLDVPLSGGSSSMRFSRA